MGTETLTRRVFVVREGRNFGGQRFLQPDGAWGPLATAQRFRLWATADRFASPLGATPCQLRPPCPPVFMEERADSGAYAVC